MSMFCFESEWHLFCHLITHMVKSWILFLVHIYLNMILYFVFQDAVASPGGDDALQCLYCVLVSFASFCFSCIPEFLFCFILFCGKLKLIMKVSWYGRLYGNMSLISLIYFREAVFRKCLCFKYINSFLLPKFGLSL